MKLESETIKRKFGILPPISDYQGENYRINDTLLIGQDPGITTKSEPTRVLMLDDPCSTLYKYISTCILKPLGL